jgi:hypothetical protein
MRDAFNRLELSAILRSGAAARHLIAMNLYG